MKKSAVIVEDNRVSADLMARQLESMGFTDIHIREMAEDGLALIRELQPGVVVIDERLPDASGTELVRTIRYEMPDTAIVMCTVVDDNHLIDAAFAAGCNYYAVKPNGFRNLCSHRGTPADLAELNVQEVYK